MVDAPDVLGGTVLSKARDWKEPIGRLGLVGQGVVATIIGLIAIRIAIGDKDQAATSEGAVAWLADQPFGKFLLVALTVALFALALWRFLCAGMGDPVEGSEPKDRLSATYRGHCRPGTGAASHHCQPATGATVSTMNRVRTCRRV